MNVSYVDVDLAVGGCDDAEAMAADGWKVVCVADNVKPLHAGFHFPLRDGGGNDPSIINSAIRCVWRFLRCDEKVFVYCRHGMNRSVLIAAAALAADGRCEWLSTGIIAINKARHIATPRDDTMQEVLDVLLKLRPAKPNHA